MYAKLWVRVVYDGQSDHSILKLDLIQGSYPNIPIQTKTTLTNSLNIYPRRSVLMETNIDSFSPGETQGSIC